MISMINRIRRAKFKFSRQNVSVKKTFIEKKYLYAKLDRINCYAVEKYVLAGVGA